MACLEALNEELYAATVAGLHYDLGPSVHGVLLSVDGFSHKLSKLAATVCEAFAALGTSDVDAEVYARVKSALELRLANSGFDASTLATIAMSKKEYQDLIRHIILEVREFAAELNLPCFGLLKPDASVTDIARVYGQVISARKGGGRVEMSGLKQRWSRLNRFLQAATHAEEDETHQRLTPLMAAAAAATSAATAAASCASSSASHMFALFCAREWRRDRQRVCARRVGSEGAPSAHVAGVALSALG